MTVATLYQVRVRLRRTPILTYALAVAVAAAAVLPSVYLVLRAAGQGGAIVDVLMASSTVRALARTVLLTTTVTATCVLLGVPLAWLTERTDLPLAKVWTVLLALPLAIPSFVGGFAVVSAV